MLDFLEKPGLVIVLLVALIVFGSKRLPDSARSLGRSMRILKAEAKGLKDDDVASPAPVVAAPVVVAPTAQPVQQSALPPVSPLPPVSAVAAPAPVTVEQQPEQHQP